MSEPTPLYHGFLALQSRGVLAFPSDLRRRMGLDEPGAQLELTERPDGVIEVRALAAVPVSQQWFWTQQWQAREREAQDDLDAGRTSTHDDVDAFLDSLPG